MHAPTRTQGRCGCRGSTAHPHNIRPACQERLVARARFSAKHTDMLVLDRKVEQPCSLRVYGKYQ